MRHWSLHRLMADRARCALGCSASWYLQGAAKDSVGCLGHKRTHRADIVSGAHQVELYLDPLLY